jgi:hypothetical protein
MEETYRIVGYYQKKYQNTNSWPRDILNIDVICVISNLTSEKFEICLQEKKHRCTAPGCGCEYDDDYHLPYVNEFIASKVLYFGTITHVPTCNLKTERKDFINNYTISGLPEEIITNIASYLNDDINYINISVAYYRFSHEDITYTDSRGKRLRLNTLLYYDEDVTSLCCNLCNKVCYTICKCGGKVRGSIISLRKWTDIRTEKKVYKLILTPKKTTYATILMKGN